MKRRTLLQWIAGVTAILPFERLRLFAQPRDLTPQAIATLQDIAPTVLGLMGVRQPREMTGRDLRG